MSRPTLDVRPVGRPLAKWACERYHYSRKIPGGKALYFGVFECDKFIGAVVYSSGSGAVADARRFGLRRHGDACELARVALTAHRSPVSRILSVTIRMLRRHCPGLRFVVSMADPRQGHIGGIYQAGNWIYDGMGGSADEVFYRGQWRHSRKLVAILKKHPGLKVPRRKMPQKYRYLYPLDKAMRRQLEQTAQPYPKSHASEVGDGGPTTQRRCDTDPDAPHLSGAHDGNR